MGAIFKLIFGFILLYASSMFLKDGDPGWAGSALWTAIGLFVWAVVDFWIVMPLREEIRQLKKLIEEK